MQIKPRLKVLTRRYFLQLLAATGGAVGGPIETAYADVVNATCSGTVSPLQQPTPNTCWATAATMLYCWKNNISQDIPTVLATAGSNYVTMFQGDQGLSNSDKVSFLAAMGLKAEVPQNYTAQGWAQLITNYGALWVTTSENTGQNFSPHARVLTSIFGDATPGGTTMVLIDPADGQVHTETWSAFATEFENIAIGDGQDSRPQVVHY